jgi:hypothetical protein
MRMMVMAAMAAAGLGAGVAEGAIVGPGGTIRAEPTSTQPDNLFGTTPPQVALAPGAFVHDYTLFFEGLLSFDTTASARLTITALTGIEDLTISVFDGFGRVINVDRDPSPLAVWFNNPGGGLIDFNGSPETLYSFRISGTAVAGGSYEGTANVFLTPLPATGLLLAGAFGGLALGLRGRSVRP